jgi:hypothetical protein
MLYQNYRVSNVFGNRYVAPEAKTAIYLFHPKIGAYVCGLYFLFCGWVY